ncbi:MAG TPA: phosphate ABC transporter ATP-binding protein PstB [Fibrobacteria bacterium]|nr:phosphate ABC transporter ATP-binding protein PstB [Fibrobacteria bacterium]
MTQPPEIQPQPGATADGAATRKQIEVRGYNAWFGSKQVLKDVSLSFPGPGVTAIIGPSGCGKSTLLRGINRMHETVPGARSTGQILFQDRNLLDRRLDAVQVRRSIGMVFQKPSPFPTMTVKENVLAGLRLNGVRDHAKLQEKLEWALRKAALWDEVKDSLDRPGVALSGGQQQRLCIARALAVDVHVLLLDEPCSALDPISTAKVEELLLELQDSLTMVIVTHNMQQAARVSKSTAFMLDGNLIEFDVTRKIFENPAQKLTEDYITGRFG